METSRTRRVVLVSLAALVLVLPALWASFASAGSQEFSNDEGEIEHTLQGAAVLLLLWSLIVGAVVRSLWLSLVVSAGGGAAVLGALCAALAFGYRTLRPSTHLASGFWAGAGGIGLRGLGLAVLGVSVGFAIGGIARRLSTPVTRPPVVGVSLAVLMVWLLSECIGWVIPSGRFQLSTHLIGWVAGDWIIYRPPSSCVGQEAATCGMYHATWQRSLPVLAAVASAALIIAWVVRAARRSGRG
ncbi:hypothetical protein AB0J20_10130 [Micromonospora costi]|uniref:hypothetical protein n=1 Tax=Micromonospora costi TaxID=1530042 RepID=UPI0034096F0F